MRIKVFTRDLDFPPLLMESEDVGKIVYGYINSLVEHWPETDFPIVLRIRVDKTAPYYVTVEKKISVQYKVKKCKKVRNRRLG